MELVYLLICSVLWLSYELYGYLTVPVLEIVNFLKVKTPYATKVSIDRIGKHSITIHWENEPEFKRKDNTDGNAELDDGGKISHYLLYLNNKQLCIFSNASDAMYTCCSINGLIANEEYRLDFITVNKLGFINRLPTIYCMTKDENFNDFSNKIEKTTNNNWKRNATILIDSSPSGSASSENNNHENDNNDTNNPNSFQHLNENIPSYNRLMNLEDLEDLTIPELRRILISSQEDLHHITSQRTRILEDFHDTKMQLEQELESLRTNWHHEMELRKSLKFNIKSLENSKALHELKLNKLHKNITISKEKSQKMEKDMLRWENDASNLDDLNKTYSEKNLVIKNDIEQTIKKINLLENEIADYELINKNLNKSNNKMLNKKELKEILKELDASISDETGLLSSDGQIILSKLTNSSSFYNLITDQLNTDSKLNSIWNSKQKDYMKRLAILNLNYKQVCLTNSQLRSKIMINPYSQNGNITSQQSRKSISSSNVNSNVNSNSNIALNNSENESTKLTGLGIMENSDVTLQTAESFSNTISNTLGTDSQTQSKDSRREFLLSSQLNNSINGQFNQYSIPTTATITANATAVKSSSLSGIASDLLVDDLSNQRNTFVEETNNESKKDMVNGQKFEYENNYHVITGLQDLVYEDTDNEDKISNYSKGFTTDQLDNYWFNAKDRPKEFMRPSITNSFPMTPSPHQTAFAFSNANDFISPISSNTMPFNSYIRNVSSNSNTANNMYHPANNLSSGNLFMSGSMGDNISSQPYRDPMLLSNPNIFQGPSETAGLLSSSVPPISDMAMFNPLQDKNSLMLNGDDNEFIDGYPLQSSNSITIGSRSRSQTNGQSSNNLIWNPSNESEKSTTDKKNPSVKKKKKKFFKK
ncbi:hypothetical protein TPHA_0F03370 [Tetrapisispora phaffii CBS 4417]|uniref:Fibronectin type-III domain-containing protein n=1 Tax=Tetrapisispora phaffii (strain ATCC 24235 / CBS 4417 / NBRC 1672 / NRRL Y-8282 / UCD 70-5) TaxID=1071381 RepID=G8BUN2_TETPH|nr:hypothetical protein TPHA_0F03370 [Tetrapisispora phaffii CBS 4417]CCE63818.1 hypothetical protein TPHA_0F03370 [Tetrapisispora phaffii CBS 4417]